MISCGKVAILLLFLLSMVAGSKYSAEKNKDDDANPFRMMKINLIWNKAKMRLDAENLPQLYQELKHQDQLAVDLKKKKAAGQDDDGEFEALVTRKSLDLLIKYGLESLHPDAPAHPGNQIYENKKDGQKWDKVMDDKKLSKLWKKAQLGGFNEKELGLLRKEFMHHMDKADEVAVVHSMLNELPDKERGNSISDLRDDQERKFKNSDLKNKHKELRDSFMKLEAQVATNNAGASHKASGGFTHPKVIELWFAAKDSNFTTEELASIQEELKHFEHKVKKLEHLEEESQVIDKKMDNKNRQLSQYPEKQLKYQDKVLDYNRKVKKYEADLRLRINQASRHNEL